jgi:hypothetical protein
MRESDSAASSGRRFATVVFSYTRCDNSTATCKKDEPQSTPRSQSRKTNLGVLCDLCGSIHLRFAIAIIEGVHDVLGQAKALLAGSQTLS